MKEALNIVLLVRKLEHKDSEPYPHPSGPEIWLHPVRLRSADLWIAVNVLVRKAMVVTYFTVGLIGGVCSTHVVRVKVKLSLCYS
jgi:hypothetical protein